ncbi:MAG TPA: cytochrome c3 family protein [Candidatus Deferrimicrobium sp.]|nr:cytochrome c3 family protein [Candidatus Deferrimicrobium sp.]
MVGPIMAVMLIGIASFPEASAVRILTPPEHSTIGSNYVYVVGTTSAPGVELLLNGVKVAVCSVKDSIFHARMSFGYGINEITAVALDSTGRQLSGSNQTVEVLYTPKSNPKYRKVYSEYYFHGSPAELACSRCHRTDTKSDTAGDSSVTCLECHGEMQNQFQRHTKSDSRACVICHYATSGMTFARSGTESSCFPCHENRRGMFSQEYVHGPVASGSCRICHNPHGSRYEKSLNHPVQILCFSCHQEVEEQLRKKEVHKPFLEGRCTSCHDPHSTNNRWALVKSSEEVCLTCHRIGTSLSGHNHPYNVRPRNKLRSALKLSVNGQLECLSCHNPHAGDAKHLLRVSQNYLCFGCHEEKR